MTALITFTSLGTDTGPFSLYSDTDGFIASFETGVSKASLLAGYSTALVPDFTSVVRVKSEGSCGNYVDVNFSQAVCLGYDELDPSEACVVECSTFYIPAGNTSFDNLFTDPGLTTRPPDGYYSDGITVLKIIEGIVADGNMCSYYTTTSTTTI